MSLNPQKVHAAISLIDMNFKDLSDITGITSSNFTGWKKGEKSFHKDTEEKIQAVLDNNRLVLTEHGVEQRPEQETEEYYGKHGFEYFMKDVYETVKQSGGDICVFNVNERNWFKWMGEDGYKAHSARMNGLNNFNFKIFVEEGDDFYIATDIAEYRHTPKKYFTQQSFYVYGNKLALLKFSDDNVIIRIINNSEWAESQRNFFNYTWEMTGR